MKTRWTLLDNLRVEDRLYPEMVTQIYRRSNIGIIATIINSTILVYVLWNHITHWVLITWGMAIFLTSLVRIGMNWIFFRAVDVHKRVHRWRQLLVISVSISGVLWGSTAICLFPVDSFTHQVFITFALAGMVAGAVGAFSPIMLVFLAFCIPALSPIIVRLAFMGDELHLAMGGMIVLFALLTFKTAQHINSSTMELVALRETFADQLEKRTFELKELNDKLYIEIEERKLTEGALADSEQYLNQIIEFLPDPTLVIDSQGIVIAWNRSMEQLTNIDKRGILGKGEFAHALPFYGELRPTLCNLVLNRDERWEREYLSLKEKNGDLYASESYHPRMVDGRYLAATASRLYDTKGNVVGAIESIRDITPSKQSEQERELLIAKLQKTITKVRTLRGLLPICSCCKKIRDDKGYWSRIETFISEHSEAEFSHSICPECAAELYPEFDVYPGS